jgi:predicted SAM-dependent methyltransferase
MTVPALVNQLSPPETATAVRLNVGCGPVQPDGWINIDNSLRAKLASRLNWLDRLLVGLRVLPPTEFNTRTWTTDIRNARPFRDNTAEAIYGGEVLEHFTRADGRRFLSECFRILRPGGVLRLRVPDNYRFWKNYVAEFDRTYARPRDQWTRQHERWVEMFFRDICVSNPRLKSMGHFHKWMYDEVSLTLAMQGVGFGDVERRGFHDSRICDVALVETRDDLIMEGVKPK